MDGGFSYNEIMGLNNLLNGNQNEEEDESNRFYSNETQSTLNPGNIIGGKKESITILIKLNKENYLIFEFNIRIIIKIKSIMIFFF